MVVAAGATAADSERCLAPEAMDALTRAGFSRHFVPRRWGGDERTFEELLTRAAAVGDACASAAWCAALYAAHGRFAAYLPYEGQRDLWAMSPDVRIAAGITPASGTAVRVGAGWRLRGEWSCVSGVGFADWLLLAAVEQGADQRSTASGADRKHVGGDVPGSGPIVRVFAVPAGDVRVCDSWHATGVRGTGSHTVVASGVPVPDHRSFPLTELLTGAPGAGRGRCHVVPAMLCAGLIFAASGQGSRPSCPGGVDTLGRPAVRAGGRRTPAGRRRRAGGAGQVLRRDRGGPAAAGGRRWPGRWSRPRRCPRHDAGRGAQPP